MQLLDGATSIDQLLNLSVDELANPAERKRQEELIIKERKKAEANQSLESIVENRRRAAANSGEEAWRDTALAATGTVRETTNNRDLLKMTNIGPSGKVVISKKKIAIDGDGDGDDNDNGNDGSNKKMETLSEAPRERMSAADRIIAENTVTLDASSFAPFKPSTNSDSNGDSDAMELDDSDSGITGSTGSIGSIGNSGSVIYRFDSMKDEDVSPSMLRIPVHLVSNVGTTRITVNLTHTPKGTNSHLKRMSLHGQCIIADRRLQGLLPSVVDCSGRIPTAEVNRTCSVAIDRKLRIVGIFQFVIDKDCATDYALYNSLYGQINDRVLCTENDKFIPGCSVTMIPQTLIGKINILRTFLKEHVHGGKFSSNTVDNNNLLLYGVITTKKWGLATHVKAIAPETIPFIRQMETSSHNSNTNRNSQSSSGSSTSTSSSSSGQSSFFSGLYN